MIWGRRDAQDPPKTKRGLHRRRRGGIRIPGGGVYGQGPGDVEGSSEGTPTGEKRAQGTALGRLLPQQHHLDGLIMRHRHKAGLDTPPLYRIFRLASPMMGVSF